MYILSRVFLFPRLLSPLSPLSHMIRFIILYFVFHSSRNGVRIKGCADSSRKYAFFAARFRGAKRKAKCERKVTKDIGRSNAHGAKLRMWSRGGGATGPWLGVAIDWKINWRDLSKGNRKRKKSYKERLISTRSSLLLSFALQRQFARSSFFFFFFFHFWQRE